MVAAVVAVVIIIAALIVTRPVVMRDDSMISLVAKNVGEDSVEVTLVAMMSPRTSDLSIVLTDEDTGSNVRTDLGSNGTLQLGDGRLFLMTYNDLIGDDLASTGDSVQINGPFTSGSYSVALLHDPTGTIICKTTFYMP